MSGFQKRAAPKQGDPIYLVVRYGKILLNSSGFAKTFYSEEHFKKHKKTYGHSFLPTDELIKYVPEIAVEKAVPVREELKQRLIELLNETFSEQYDKRGILTAPHTAEALIANGVTIRERGEWVLEHETYGKTICSACKKECPIDRKPDPHAEFQMTDFYIESDFCPRCGADMRGDSE